MTCGRCSTRWARSGRRCSARSRRRRCACSSPRHTRSGRRGSCSTTPSQEAPGLPTIRGRRRRRSGAATSPSTASDGGRRSSSTSSCGTWGRRRSTMWRSSKQFSEACASARARAPLRRSSGWRWRSTSETCCPRSASPTLVLAMPDRKDEAAYIAGRIPQARMLENRGPDFFVTLWADELYDEIERFVRGLDAEAEPETVLATVLFTDIVDSTTTAAELGDRAWSRARVEAPRARAAKPRHVPRRRDRHRRRRILRELRRARSGPSGAPARSATPSGRSAWRSAPACTRANASASTGRSAGSP